MIPVPRGTFVFGIVLLFLAISCAENGEQHDSKNNIVTKKEIKTPVTQESSQALVTMVELGSKKCIPCKAMQKVMDSLEVRYPNDLKIIFHDIWTPEGKPYGQEFGIRSIPTQVFLDNNGKEIFRHEGFFPLEEIVTLLKKSGVAQ